MKRLDFNELIEKAFSMGYEYAQKEYARKDYEGLTKRQKEELRKRRRDYAISLNKVRNNFKDNQGDFAWNDSRALNNVKTTSQVSGGGIETTVKTETNRAGRNGKAFEDGHRKSHLSELLKQSEKAGELMRENVEKEIKPGIAHKDQKKHGWITNKTENAFGRVKGNDKKWQRDHEIRNDGKFDKHYYDLKNTEFRDNDELNKKLERLRKEKEYAGLFDKAEAKERFENIKKIRTNKNLKKAGLIGAGILGTGIAAYAGKKAYNKYKAKKQKEQKEKENK